MSVKLFMRSNFEYFPWPCVVFLVFPVLFHKLLLWCFVSLLHFLSVSDYDWFLLAFRLCLFTSSARVCDIYRYISCQMVCGVTTVELCLWSYLRVSRLLLKPCFFQEFQFSSSSFLVHWVFLFFFAVALRVSVVSIKRWTFLKLKCVWLSVVGVGACLRWFKLYWSDTKICITWIQ